MYRMIKKKAVGCVLLLAMIVTMFSQSSLTAEAVKVSDMDYTVSLKGSYVYIGNEIPGPIEIGQEYYMTYTVQSAPVASMNQQGLIGATDIKQRHPHMKGGYIRWTSNEEHSMMKEGYTYFIKFVAAKGGFTYNITRAKDDKVERVILDQYWGTQVKGYSHFGVWISGDIQAELIKVHCYDATGKDLGVKISANQGTVIKNEVFEKNTKVKHSYEIEIKDKYNVALSNLRKPTSDVVFMEYKVEAADVSLSQEGLSLSKTPLNTRPYQSGFLKYTKYEKPETNPLLLDPGAEYIVKFEKIKNGFEAVVQKTKNGERTMIRFDQSQTGKSNNDSKWFSLWFGDSETYPVNTLHLKDFKCYDSNGNNLAVQCNQAMKIKHYGEIEDYASSVATYYCEENGNLFALYEENTMKYTKDGVTTEGTYNIVDEVLTTKLDGIEEKYEYLHLRATDSSGNVYRRLKTYTVDFETYTDMEIESQELSNDAGYLLMRPTDPIMEGKEFDGWYTGEGKKFEFDTIVTRSTTLYAKYLGDEVEVQDDVEVDSKPIWPIVIGAVVLVAVAATVTTVVVVRRGGKHGSNEEE